MPLIVDMFTDICVTYVNVARDTPRIADRRRPVEFRARRNVCSKRHSVQFSAMSTMATDVWGTVIAYQALAFVAPSWWGIHREHLMVAFLP